MKSVLMAAIVAVITAAITMACGAPVAQQPTTQVVEVQADQPTTQVVEVQAAQEGSYWSLSANKSFKAIEYGCTLGWRAVAMPNGCVVVIDRTQKGYGHNGRTAPFGVVIPSDMGVTITYGWDGRVFVSAKAKTYTFVLLDESDARIVQTFSSSDPQWDDDLLREFFIAQMGGDLDSIWREGVSDDID
jgi:hypothetical protein